MLDLTPLGFRIHTSATLSECAILMQRAEELWAQLPKTGPIIIEFDAVTDIDSSALAVLLDWQKTAQAESRTLQLRNTPPNLQHLAKLYGIADWIDGLAA